jgi:hypothetical protein
MAYVRGGAENNDAELRDVPGSTENFSHSLAKH